MTDIEMRISDADRNGTLRRLHNAVALGLLDIDEFEERSAMVSRARLPSDLDALVGDLPGPGAIVASAADRVELRGVFGSLRRQGEWVVPTRLALPVIGWRGLFIVAAALFVLASLLILWLLPRDEERSAAGGQIDGAPLWGGYAEVFRSAYFWRFALVSMLSHAGFVSLQTLWAGPWLMQVDGLSAEAAAQVLLVFNVALMGGFMVVGALAPTIARRGWPMTTFTATGTALLLTAELAIALWPGGAGAWVLWPLLALVSTFFSMVQPHVGLSFPPALTGRAYTAYNLLLFVAMFGWQWLFGVGVDLWTAAGRAGADGFRATMFSAIGVQVTGLAVFLSWRAKPAPSPH